MRKGARREPGPFLEVFLLAHVVDRDIDCRGNSGIKAAVNDERAVKNLGIQRVVFRNGERAEFPGSFRRRDTNRLGGGAENDLLTSEIPEDCSLLIVNAPTSDLASDDGLVDEASMLQNYLNEGGRMLLTTNEFLFPAFSSLWSYSLFHRQSAL